MRNGNTILEIPHGLVRRDVELAKSGDYGSEVARFSGFELSFDFNDGPLVIEVDLGKGYLEAASLSLHLATAMQYVGDYSDLLPTNLANHRDIVKGKETYFFEESKGKSILLHKKDPKIIAFYLPQFHPIPENDKAWGPGFTEWTNVAAGQPKFVGHNQPLLPRDLGYYDLRLDHNIEQQINLAKQHGIYAFCFYYYWFSGKKILDQPIRSFLKRNDWDFNFMVCWANENWTKRWDGADKEIIISQKYRRQDPLLFIKDVEKILLDKRYVQVDGKPALVVYRPKDLGNPKNYAKIWRDYFRKNYGRELHLIAVLGFDQDDPKNYGFDSGIDFMPLGLGNKKMLLDDERLEVDVSRQVIYPGFGGSVYDYRRVILNENFHKPPYSFPTYPCVMPSWDNDARRKGNGYTFHNTSPDIYARWLEKALPNQEILFINAWNEWGEGTTLEPTQLYGHAVLNRTSEVLAQHSKNLANRRNFPIYGISKRMGVNLAVIVHLYYIDQWSSIAKRLKNITVPFDLYISVRISDASFKKNICKYFPSATVIAVPNRGRDILPFVHICRRLDKAGYSAVLKLHTKKSLHRLDGNIWAKDLVSALLPNKLVANNSARKVIAGKAAMIGPKNHYVQLQKYMGSNQQRISELLISIFGSAKAKKFLSKQEKLGYFAGSMFWANMKTLRPILNQYFMSEDFDMEAGQTDGTTAHAIERLFGVLAVSAEGKILQSGLIGHQEIDPTKGSVKYKYVG